jgi:hypothetical protein
MVILITSTPYILLDKAINSFSCCPLSKDTDSPILGLDKACPNGVFEVKDPSRYVCGKGFLRQDSGQAFGKKRLRITYSVVYLLLGRTLVGWQ